MSWPKSIPLLLPPGLMVIVAALPLALVLAVMAPNPAGRPSCARAAGANQVAVVVEHGDGGVLTKCVSFAAAQVTGDQLMQMSGIEYGTVNFGGFGKAVCQVDHEPASYPASCWTSSSPYWGMFVSHAGGPWAISRYGISSQQFSEGDALGWHYVPASGGGPPPSPAGVCVPAPPSASPSGAASNSPIATPTTAAAVSPGPAYTPLAPAQIPSPTGEPTSAQAVPSDSPVPGAAAGTAPSDPAPPSTPARPDLGWLGAAIAAGSLLGLLAVRLLAQRIRP